MKKGLSVLLALVMVLSVAAFMPVFAKNADPLVFAYTAKGGRQFGKYAASYGAGAAQTSQYNATEDAWEFTTNDLFGAWDNPIATDPLEAEEQFKASDYHYIKVKFKVSTVDMCYTLGRFGNVWGCIYLDPFVTAANQWIEVVIKADEPTNEYCAQYDKGLFGAGDVDAAPFESIGFGTIAYGREFGIPTGTSFYLQYIAMFATKEEADAFDFSKWVPAEKPQSSEPEESKTEESKTEESKTEESKTEESKTEESKTEESKTEESKVEESKVEESQSEESQGEEQPPELVEATGDSVIYDYTDGSAEGFPAPDITGYQYAYDEAEKALKITYDPVIASAYTEMGFGGKYFDLKDYPYLAYKYKAHVEDPFAVFAIQFGGTVWAGVRFDWGLTNDKWMTNIVDLNDTSLTVGGVAQLSDDNGWDINKYVRVGDGNSVGMSFVLANLNGASFGVGDNVEVQYVAFCKTKEEAERVAAEFAAKTAGETSEVSEPETSEPETSEPETSEPEDIDGSSFPWWIIVIAAAVVIAAIIIIIAASKKKK